MEPRPQKDRYYLSIALSVAERSPCIRRRYGAVIVKGDNIVGTGYNGPARGVINCIDVGCTKDVLDQKHYGSYEYCTAVHAEENAIINSNRAERTGATMYVAGYDAENELAEAEPCKFCRRKIINSMITDVLILKADDTIKRMLVDDWKSEDTAWYIQTLAKAKSGELESG